MNNPLTPTQRYFIELQYDGTNYHGWQYQNNAKTVQEVLEYCFSKRLNETVEITGCGRTDTGVHASFYVAHFESSNPTILSDQFIYQMNSFLPKDISILSIYKVQPDAHARFSATSRTYNYFIHTKKNAFKDHYSHYIYGTLDVEAMQKACQYLIGRHDFSAFCKDVQQQMGTMCTVEAAYWTLEPDGSLKFTITANRFLRNMVRATVGTLLNVGRNNYEPEHVSEILALKTRSAAGESVPAKGLFLVDIRYEDLLL